MTAVAASGKPKIEWHEFVICSNEIGQKEVLTKLATEKRAGNAIWGCGGVCVLNMASVCEGIEQIAVFDISDKIQGLWEKLQKFVPTFDPDKLEESQKRFSAWIRSEYPFTMCKIDEEIEQGISFLSSSDRLKRICNIFRAQQVSFTKVDIGNPREFLLFKLAQDKKKAIPRIVYISNIAFCGSGALANAVHGLELCQRWDGFRRSLSLIPKDAVIVDAKGVCNAGRLENSLQGIHASDKREGVMPTIQELFSAVVQANDYHAVTWCLKNGADPTQVITASAQRGHLYSLMALLDHKVDVNTPDHDNITPLIRSVLGNQPDILELLVSRNANVNHKAGHNRTALHQAAGFGRVKLARALLEFGADRNLRDSSQWTAFDLTRHPDMPVYSMRGTPEYAELQALLKKGCKTREPRTFSAPAAHLESKDNTNNKMNSEKADSKKGE